MYGKIHYNVTGFCKEKALSSGIQNILIKLKMALIRALNEQVLLPKAIVIVVDDDIMDSLHHYDAGFSYSIGILIEWLCNEFHDIIKDLKDQLPSKARKFKYPTILWATIPLHEVYGEYNNFKEKFNKCIKKTTSLFCEMGYLEITWNMKDLAFFDDGRISSVGLSTYWSLIDAAFERWDRSQMKNQCLKLPPQSSVLKKPTTIRQKNLQGQTG